MGATPSKEELLYQEVQNGNHDAVKSLRRDGASLEWIDKEGRTPLLLACSRGELLDMTITLLNLGANMKAYCSGSHGGYPVHYAAKRGLDKTVTLLLSRGADPLAINDDGQTPLDMARSRGHAAVVRLLEEQLCLFTGMLRELSGPGILESLAANLITKKVWAVVLPQKRCGSIAGAREYELAIYESPMLSLWNGLRSSSTHPAGLCNVAQPRTVLTLSKVEMEEPDFSASDPVLCIWDRIHKMKIKLFAQKRGDREQVDKLYRACKGMLECQTQLSVSNHREHTPDEFKQQNKQDLTKVISLQQSLSSCMQPILQSVSAPSSARFMSCSSNSAMVESMSEEFALALALNESIRSATAGSMSCLPGEEASPFSTTDEEKYPSSSACDGCSCQGVEPYGQYKPKIKNGQANKPMKSVSQRWKTSSIRFFTRSFREVPDAEVSGRSTREYPSEPPFPDKTQICHALAETDSRSKCVVCWDAPAEGACIPCGHLAGCMNCVTRIHSEGLGCPVCRSTIEQVIKVYTV